MSIYMKMPHRADVYSKTVVTNQAGQSKATWSLTTSSVKCAFTPRYPRMSGISRTTPTYENSEAINFFMPANIVITYDTRLYNVKDRAGNLIDAGPFEIVSIIKQPGFSGKHHHYLLTARRIVES